MVTLQAKNAFNAMNPTAQRFGLGTMLAGLGAVQAPRNLIFVDKTIGVDDHPGGMGATWDKPFKTVLYAVTHAVAYDWIFINDGVYDEGAVIPITTEGIKLIGTLGHGYEWGPCSLKASAADHIIITIDANGVGLYNLGFIQNNAKACVSLATTAAIYKTHIKNCHFGCGTGTYGVYTGDTWDAVDTVIESCEVYKAATTGIRMNGTRNKTMDNLIFVPANGIGIEYVPGTADRPNSLITRNQICGMNSGDTGIKITNTPDAGAVGISWNTIMGCATTITQKTNNAYNTCNNYKSDTAGGSLIDTCAE